MKGIKEDFDNKPHNIHRKVVGEIIPLYALKYVCAVMVVGIHLPFFANPVLLPVYRIAVPVFFMITGYFLVDSQGTLRAERIEKTLRKILLITLSVYAIYWIFKALIYGQYVYPVVPLIVEGGGNFRPTLVLDGFGLCSGCCLGICEARMDKVATVADSVGTRTEPSFGKLFESCL